MTTVKLITEQGDTLEILEVKNIERFILLRGRLFERVISEVKSIKYMQRQYVEIY